MEILNEIYTIIEECFDEDTIGNRIRYGNVYKNIKTQGGRVNCIKPGNIIILQRWSGGVFGTKSWYLYIFKTGAGSTQIPNVYPNVDLLLFCSGATRVKRTLAVIEEFVLNKVDINNLKDDYFIRQNSRLSTGKKVLYPGVDMYAI